jgi:nicotinamidase/pyrazinamidase
MKALIIVDVQNDFFEGGPLEVPHSNQIIPVINQLVASFNIVIFTKDWHPANHKSFASNHKDKNVYDVVEINSIQQVLWPDHCIQNTFGSGIHQKITIPQDAYFFTKGSDMEVDSYSGFYDNGKIHSTGLSNFLHKNKISDVYLCGLATEFCVKFTAIDAVNEKFNTFLITDATRAVNINSGDFDKAIEEMKSKGVNIVNSNSIQQMQF